jgi:excinuclease UvrABC ATPase subunit
MITVTAFKLEHHRAIQAEQNGMYHVAVQNYLHCLSSVQGVSDSGMTALFAQALERCYAKMGLFDKAARYARLSLVKV